MSNENAVTPVSLADLPDDHPVFHGSGNKMLLVHRDRIRARRAHGLPDYPEPPQPQESTWP